MSEISLPVITTETEVVEINPEKPDYKKWLGLGILSLGLAIVIIDTTLLNVSLSYLLHDLKTDIKSLQWVITSYTLILAAFTITGGRLGDLFGRKRMFMLGAIIFAVGSFIASMSHNLTTLLIGESIIEGIGAALMMPATSSLVVTSFKGKERAMAFGIWGAVAGASSAVGPLLGGWLASHYSWRWGFRINIVVAAVVVLGALWLIKESKDERKPSLDFVGVILSSLGLLGITYGIIESSTYGWLKAKALWSIFGHEYSLWNLSITPIVMGIGFIFLVFFVLWEQRVEKNGGTPLVSMSLLKNRAFTAGTLTMSVLTLGMTGTFFALPIYLQAVKGMDAFKTGLAFLPLSLGLLIVAPLSGVLGRKIPARYLIQIGLIIDIIAALVIRQTISVDMQPSHLIFGLGLYGAGMGLVMAPISNISLSAAPPEQSGEASGVNNTMRQVGATLGSAIVGAAVITILATTLSRGIEQSTVIPAQIKTQIIQKLSKDETAAAFGGLNIPAGSPPEIGIEIKSLADQATTHAARDGFIYAAMFAALALAASLFLPKGQTEHEDHSHEGLAITEHSGRTFLVAGIIAVAALTAGIIMLRNSSHKAVITKITSVDKIEDIQNAFLPEVIVTTPQVNSSVVVSRNELRGGEVRGATTPAPSLPTPYTNSILGISTVLPPSWQAQEFAKTSVIFINSSNDSVQIQMYDRPGITLEEIEKQLTAASSAKNISRTEFLGYPAIAFTANGYDWRGFIRGNRLYYVMGRNISQEPVSNIKFF